ncbi:hypothetical protein LIER_41572 [Lithospermum erythrorhizon]|uniref:ATP-dependent DNA helicase n=1 Tax=Lithospermum erythrorhizon TaxID=34254 RepID=A0AAV3RBC7_LITER
MRARFDPDFVEFLMMIGNGEEPANEKHEIQIPQPMLIQYTSLEQSIEDLISYVYPDLSLFETTPFDMMQRIILCPKNDFVNYVNSKLIQRISREPIIYISDDRTKHASDQGDYVDYLNNLEPKGLTHELNIQLTLYMMKFL